MRSEACAGLACRAMRTILRTARLARMLAAVASRCCVPAVLRLRSGAPNATPPGSTPPRGIRNIDHIIIVVQENRSFDHYFGTFPGANGLPRGPARPLQDLHPRSRRSTPAGTRTTTQPVRQGGNARPRGLPPRRERREDERVRLDVPTVRQAPARTATMDGSVCRFAKPGPNGDARRDGLPHRPGDPELLDLREAVPAAGPDVRARRLVHAARRTCTSFPRGPRRCPTHTPRSCRPTSRTPGRAGAPPPDRRTPTSGPTSHGSSTSTASHGRTTSAPTRASCRPALPGTTRRPSGSRTRSRGSRICTHTHQVGNIQPHEQFFTGIKTDTLPVGLVGDARAGPERAPAGQHRDRCGVGHEGGERRRCGPPLTSATTRRSS